MEFHLIQAGAVGRRKELEQGMAGQRDDLYQRYLEEVRAYVHAADELGYTGYGHNEHHLQIEGFEETNHPGMSSMFIGLNSKRLRANTLGYVLPTHNPVRVAEEIATLDHVLKGRLAVGFTRGYQARWFQNYAAVPGARATTPDLAKRHDEQDRINREIFEESVRIVKTAWTNDVFSYEGKYWTFPPKDLVQPHSAYLKFGKGVEPDGRVTKIGIAPRPYQKPYPKLYGAFAHSMRTIRFWAREGGKPIVLANNLEFCRGLWDAYKEEADRAGRSVAADDIAAWGGIISIDRSRERALAETRGTLVGVGSMVPAVRPGAADGNRRNSGRGQPPDRNRLRSARLQRSTSADWAGVPGAGRGGGRAGAVREQGNAAIFLIDSSA